MKRIVWLVTVAVLMVVMIAATALPALALPSQAGWGQCQKLVHQGGPPFEGGCVGPR
jgi:hypothetical protein